MGVKEQALIPIVLYNRLIQDSLVGERDSFCEESLVGEGSVTNTPAVPFSIVLPVSLISPFPISADSAMILSLPM